MAVLSQLYRDSLSLLTDLYQLTMAYGYWKSQMAEREAVFHLQFRRHPFGGQYAVACGLTSALEWIEGMQFGDPDLEYLRTLRRAGKRRLFPDEFLEYLAGMHWRVSLDAMPEGTVAFAGEPLLRVRGPLLQCQLLETPLLTLMNFQTLVATKAARVCLASRDEQVVIEFGLRRAQGIDGGITASRAAYVGGCSATSNVLAGRLFGIPVRGTHAHSWVMAFDDELTAFDQYSRVLPHNSVLLVDTYDTMQGVEHAIQVGRRMRGQGDDLLGVRLDSGDLLSLSQAVRRALDEAGFPETRIVASSDLDEYEIERLNRAGARIDIWGVGTRLSTAYDDPALGGVYKLAAIRGTDGAWRGRVKLSDNPAKSTLPGMLQVRRFGTDQFHGDVIYDELFRAGGSLDPVDASGQAHGEQPSDEGEDLLVAVLRQGERCYDPPDVHSAQARTRRQLQRLPEAVKRLAEPVAYPVRLDRQLYQLRAELLQAARGALE